MGGSTRARDRFWGQQIFARLNEDVMVRAPLRKARISASPPGANEAAARSSSDSPQSNLEHLIWSKDERLATPEPNELNINFVDLRLSQQTLTGC